MEICDSLTHVAGCNGSLGEFGLAHNGSSEMGISTEWRQESAILTEWRPLAAATCVPCVSCARPFVMRDAAHAHACS